MIWADMEPPFRGKTLPDHKMVQGLCHVPMRVRTKAGLINSQRVCGEYQRIAGGIASSKPHRLKNRKSAFSHFRNLDAPKREVRFGLSTDIASVVWQLTSANWRSSRVILIHATSVHVP